MAIIDEGIAVRTISLAGMAVIVERIVRVAPWAAVIIIGSISVSPGPAGRVPYLFLVIRLCQAD